MNTYRHRVKIWIENGGIFVFLLTAYFIFYWGCRRNYFFSDDFEWLARAVLAQDWDGIGSIFAFKGRDFNPLFTVFLAGIIKIFGLSHTAFRVVGIVLFTGVSWFFFYILNRYFTVHRVIALTATLLFGFNVYISEILLNTSALVYSLATFFFLASAAAYMAKRRGLFIILLLAAFLTKETVILGIIPLLLVEKERKSRGFIFIALIALVSVRSVIQLTFAGSADSYTDFMDYSNVFIKLYFILLRSMNLSPYTFSLPVGAGIIAVVVIISLYVLIRIYRGQPFKTELSRSFPGSVLYFFSSWVIFSLFFSFLPKLSSRYFFFPAIFFWGMAASLFSLVVLYLKNKKRIYMIGGMLAVPVFLSVSVMVNYPLVQREIMDYRILGDFSLGFMQQEETVIKSQLSMDKDNTSRIVILYKMDYSLLKAAYQTVIDRGNMPKLLPFREHAVGGIIEPADLVPIVLYPGRTARWIALEETDRFFKGKIVEFL